MGFTWIIGLFAVGEEGRVFAYLFVFANVFQVRGRLYCSTVLRGEYEQLSSMTNCHRSSAHFMQGLFIFLFHVVRHEKAYGKIKSKFPNIRKWVSIVKYSIQALRHLTVLLYS